MQATRRRRSSRSTSRAAPSRTRRTPGRRVSWPRPGPTRCWLASLVNVSALVRYVRARAPASGHDRAHGARGARTLRRGRPLRRGPGRPVRGRAQRRRPKPSGERLRDAPAARKFFDPACDWAPRPDFDYCTDVDRFDFVLRLRAARRRVARTRAHRHAGGGMSASGRLGLAPVRHPVRVRAVRADAARRRAAAPSHARGGADRTGVDHALQAGRRSAFHGVPGHRRPVRTPARGVGDARQPVRPADGLRAAVAALRGESRPARDCPNTCRTTGVARSCCSSWCSCCRASSTTSPRP